MIRQLLIAVALVASLACACPGAEGDHCSDQDGCMSCVVCQASCIVHDQPAPERIETLRFLPPISDLPSSTSFVEVPFQPPRVQVVG